MSHQLCEITISNFKSIKLETFDLESFTPLVGYNNAGKSNILESIKWLLRKSSLSEAYFNDNTKEIEMIGKISGITESILSQLSENQKSSISPYLFSETLFIKRIQASPNVSVTNIKLYIKDPENVNTENEWKLNPTGLDQAIQALFPEPIHIGAMENSEEDVSKNKNSTTIGKLLAEIIGPIQENYTTKVQESLDGIKELLDANGGSRATELKTFDTEINNKIDSFFPGVSIKVHIPTPELKEVFSKGTIKVFEGLDSFGKDVSSLGHGAQRSIQMALIQHLADIKKDENNQSANTLLLIDEPELYLHPQAIEKVSYALRTLSKQGYQVIFSTHSPFMITAKDVENTLLIRKEESRGTHKRNSLKSAISTVAASHPSQLGIIFSLSNSSNILFSEKVILAEGKTENKILPKIIQNITGKTLGIFKIALVPMDGSGSTKKTIDVLKAMGMPTKAIVDIDYALREGEKQSFLDKDDQDVSTIKLHLSKIATKYNIKLNNGWPTSKESILSASDAFSILAKEKEIESNIKNIKKKMLDSGIYMWTKGTIENHLGDISKNEDSWANFNFKLENEDIKTILPNDYLEIKEFVKWLVS